MEVRLRSALIVSLCLLASVVPTDAEQLDSLYVADIIKLLEMTGSAKMGEQLAPFVSSQIIEVYRQTNPHVPDRAFDMAQEFLEEEFARAFQGPDGFLATMAPMYAKYLNHAEVRGLIAFYETDLGRKVVAVMPNLMMEGMKMGEAWGLEIAPNLMRRVRERLKAEGFDLQEEEGDRVPTETPD